MYCRSVDSLLAREPESARPTDAELAALLELAGRGERPRPRRARWWLSVWAASRPEALPRVLEALPGASDTAREAAGQWLFEPELEDELTLRRALLAQVDGLLALAARLPEPWLLEGLAELVAARGGGSLKRLLDAAQGEDWARRVVELLPPEVRLTGDQGPCPENARCAQGPVKAGCLRRLVRTGRWRELAGEGREALARTRSLVGDSSGALDAPPLAWPAGPQALAVLEDMARLVAAEGRAAHQIAVHLSRGLGRVVILGGNASLGGPPMWAVPGPWQSEPASLPTAGPLPAPPWDRALVLANLRAARLGGPPLLRALWQARAACLLAGRGRRAYEALAYEAAPWLSPEQRDGLAQGSLGLSLAAPPWQQALAQARRALEHCDGLERQARAALGWVYGLASKGAPPLVLPWADKFVASTAKAGDHLYLARLAALLAGLGPPPLLLIIDDTVHPGFPSLAMVLAEAGRVEPGLVFRGVGAFGGEAEPRDLASAALAAARGAHVVVLRPAPGPHPAAGLASAARGEAGGLPLTPASRDGASWLLAGTGLAPLSDWDAPAAPDEPPPWLLTEAGFAPLGAWLRRRVAGMAGRLPPHDRRWRLYAHVCGLA